ncbi:hypothetical protein L9F63_020617, partial [Diploptera punctata]
VVATCVALCCLHFECASEGISLQTAQFSLDLLKTLPQEKNRNVVFSPLSIYSLLAVLQQGSNGSSRTEMNKILHAAAEVTREALKNVTASIEQSDSLPSLRFVWKSRIKGNHNFTPEFQKVLRQDSKSRFRSEDTWNNADGPTISSPKGFLSKIVVPSRSSSKTFAALANLLYFNGMWANYNTEERMMRFRPRPSEEYKAESIHMKKTCFIGAASEVGAKWIHMPLAVRSNKQGKAVGVKPRASYYWSKRSISFMIMLPTEKHKLDKMLQKLTPEILVKSFNYSSVTDSKGLELTIPSFHVNSSVNFKPVLKKLGLRSVFGNGTGLSDVSTEQQLFLSKITQKGQLFVDTYGIRTSQNNEINFPYRFSEPLEESQQFTVDEPFLFFIVDRQNSLPLVAGRVTRPQMHEEEQYDAVLQ